MLRYLFKTKQGQYLMIGIFTLIGGLLLPGTISNLLFYSSIYFLGYFATKNALHDTIVERKLNVDLLMILAALGACFIRYESEGAILLLIFAFSGLLEEYANSRSSQAIESLMNQVPDTAQLLLENGSIEEVAVTSLKINNIILVPKGAQIPIDGITDRQVILNESALTGESLSVVKEKGEEVFAGTLNEGDAFRLTVNKLAHETVFSNIIHLVKEAQSRPSKTAKFIDQIENRYVIAVLIAVPLLIAILYFGNGLSFQEAFYRGMVFLTVASPCALVASVTPATLAAISNGAKNGVLFKGGATLEALSTMTTLFSDKTGTLTYGEFRVVEYSIPDELLPTVVFMEQSSTHPIAKAIAKYFLDVSVLSVNQNDLIEELAGIGLKMGKIQIGKPQKFIDKIGYDRYMDKINPEYTTVLIVNQEIVVGYISLEDSMRETAITAVKGLKDAGVGVVLLTGDNAFVAGNIAAKAGIDVVHSELLPKDKLGVITQAQVKGEIVGMIGDGINDAPALAQADIGIAMGSGSSVAVESSDIVMVKNDLDKLLYSFKLSQKLNRLIRYNVGFAIAVIVLLVALNVMGVMPLPLAVICHEGSTLLVILNGLRLLKSRR